VQPPQREGFGSTIITRSFPYHLGGKATVRYELVGFEADFCVPARHISGPQTPAGCGIARRRRRRGRPRRCRRGRRRVQIGRAERLPHQAADQR
jgi:hypothetical protein